MKIKTVLIVALMVVCCGNAFAQQPTGRTGFRRLQRQRGQEDSNRNKQRSVKQGVPGVTAPLIPFDEKDKIKYEDAVERAKKNDAEAFYWLAYYFAKGEEVVKDRKTAGKFLQKAADLGHLRAKYLIARFHEDFTLQNEKGPLKGPLIWHTNIDCAKKIDEVYPAFNGDFFHMPTMPSELNRSDWGKWYCCTNEVVYQYVMNLYSDVVKGGLPYATNDIARLQRLVDECRERIAIKEKAKNKGTAALDLLVDASAKEAEDAKQKEDEERKTEREYWATWPRTLGDEEMALLDVDFEKKFNCVFLEPNSMPMPRRLGLMRPGVRSVSGNSRTNTWVMGRGKSLIAFHGANNEFFQKVDPNGLIVAWGLTKNRTDLEELKWYEEEKEKRLVPLRSKWAKERGMSLEEAMQKYKAWQEQSRMSPPPQPNRLLRLNNRPGLNVPPPNNRPLSGLEIARMRRERQLADEEQQRQAAELAKKEREQEAEARKQAAERKQLAEERKAQLDQLMQIQEELRRQREEKLRELNNMK